MSTTRKRVYGYLAEFKSASALYKGAEKIRDAGFKKWDCYSPYPIHGLDGAMGAVLADALGVDGRRTILANEAVRAFVEADATANLAGVKNRGHFAIGLAIEQKPHRDAGFLVRTELLVVPRGVVLDEPICEFENRRRRAVIVFEPDHARFREVMAEVENVQITHSPK